MASGDISPEARIQITPELFSINYLQYYVETRYSFVQDMSPERMAEMMRRRPFEIPEYHCTLNESERTEIREHRAHLSDATAYMMSGSYREALDALEHAERGYQRHFPQYHMTRLEISSFRSLLLVLNSNPVGAEALCMKTLSILSEQNGYAHPLTLVTMSIMVLIQLKLWHIFPAVDTATTLVQEMSRVLGRDNMLTLHSKVILAAARFHKGEYSKAETELESIIPILEDSLGSDHPDMFQYESLLANVHFKKGKFEDVTKRLVPVLEQKLQEYSTGPNGSARVGLGGFLHDFIKDPKTAFSDKKPHPEFLKGLTIYAETLFQRQSSEHFPVSILKAVWLQERTELGDSHLDTAATLIRLATAKKMIQEDIDTYMKVREQLESVIQVRQNVLGRSHAATLCAQRENLALGYKIKSLVHPGPWTENEEKNPLYFQGKDVYAESQHIYDSHKSHLGRYHIETIRSLDWLFKIWVSKSFHEKTTAVTNELLHCAKVVRDNCPAFSLSVEFTAAFTFYELGYYHTSRQIAVRTLQVIDDSIASGGHNLPKFFERFREENRNFIEHLNDKIRESES